MVEIKSDQKLCRIVQECKHVNIHTIASFLHVCIEELTIILKMTAGRRQSITVTLPHSRQKMKRRIVTTR